MHIELPSGSYLTFDKAYNGYAQFARFTKKGIFFITRQKDNAIYTSVSETLLTKDMPDELLKEEEVIQQVYKDEKGKEHLLELRRIAWWDTVSGRAYEFISNNFIMEAAMIAAIYR